MTSHDADLILLHDPARLAELQHTALLDSGADEAFDRLTRLAAALLNAPVALISLVDADRQYFKSHVGLPEPWASTRETPLSHSFCQHTVTRGDPLIIGDARRDPRVATNPAIRDLNVIAYAGIPLVTRTDHILGSFCVIDHHPRRWTAHQIDSLRDLAASVMTEIERRELERQLRAALTTAETANAAKSEFLANMSHEIRTPMAAILGYTEVLAARLKAPDDRQSIHTIQRNGQHLLALINDLLDLSKIEAGRLEVARERVDLAALLAEVISLMTVRAQEKGLRLTIDEANPLPETIESDARRLKQILLNLVGNAIKFTERGQITVRVALVEQPRPRLRVEVIDTGIGIDAAVRSSLFQPFTQGDRSVTREQGGTGLGLLISRRLAERLGGTITVDSRVGHGSTFTATVATGPLKGVSRGPLHVRRAKLELAAVPPPPRGQLSGHVLVVDDHPELCYLTRHYLETAGARVATVNNGLQALDAVANAAASDEAAAAFDAVVLDLQMPMMDGLTTARRLRVRGYRGAIVALTAHAMTGDRDRCLAAGCDAYLSKPIDSRLLIDTLAAVLPTPRSRVKACAASSGNRQRVLVVDDSADAATALATALRLSGFEADTALTGQAAMAKARKEPPAVIILDLNLPDLSGNEVCRRLHHEPGLQQTVFIALSGDSDTDTTSASFDHRAIKPTPIADLVALFSKRAGHGG